MTRRGRQAPDPQRRHVWAALAVLALAGCLAYVGALPNPFILDDEFAVIQNTQIRQLLPLSVPLSPPGETAVARRPLVNVTLAINYALAGLDVRGYRAVNLAIFLTAAAVLLGLVRRTLWLGGPGRTSLGDATHLAAAVALLWLLHPINSEVVNYVSQRSESLMGLCYLLTLYCSLRWVDTRRPVWNVWAVLSCAAGMACKESMVTAPILVVFFDRTFVFPSFRAAFRARSALYAALASCWLLLAALMASGSRSTVGFDTGVSPWTYLLNQARVVATYLWLSVWPYGLVVDYGQPRDLALTDVAGLAALVVVACLGSLAALRKWPRAGFLAVSVFVLLAPTSSVVPIASEVGAERRMFLPSAAIVILIVCAVHRTAAWLAARLGGTTVVLPTRQNVRTLAFTGAAVASIGGSLLLGVWSRNREYRSALALAQTTVDRHPHGRAFYWLGIERLRAGERRDGFRLLRESAPEFAPARFALGTELLADGDLDGAIRQLRMFIEAMPERGEVGAARLQIAMALRARGDYESALAELRAIVARDARSTIALTMMGELLILRGRSRAAIFRLEQALAIDEDNAVLHDLLGLALADVGRLASAVSHFRRSVELDPTFRLAQAHLAAVRAQQSPAGRPSVN